jgi:hypothetical protein
MSIPLPCKMSQLPDNAENEHSSLDGPEQQKEAPLQQEKKRKQKKRKIANDDHQDAAPEVETHRNDGGQHIREEAIKMVETFNANDFTMNRAVIRRLAQAGGSNGNNGTKEISLSRGGTSKAAVNKSKALCAYATNGLARLLASKTPNKANEIRETMLATAAQRAPDLSPGIEGPSRAAAPSPSKKAKVMNSLAVDMGYMLRDMLRNMRTPSERRPFLAVLAHNRAYTKPSVEEYLGIKIHHGEWSLIRSHPNCSAAVNGG